MGKGYEKFQSEYDQEVQFRDEPRLRRIADKVFELAIEDRDSLKGQQYMSLFNEIDSDLIDLETSSELDNRGEV